MLIRTDLPLAQQLVQAAHATYESAGTLGYQPNTSLVVLAVPDEPALLRHAARLTLAGVAHTVFYEPDVDQRTALATRPLTAADRRHFRGMSLWTPAAACQGLSPC